jgi:EAL domain-containing protein (putative c-di-GMP-specific phosphodiesterase class I)/GGDEF domain-containing protein
VSISVEAEAERLDALQRLDLLDTPPSEAFDRITRMAAHIFDLPIAAVSLTDRDRQWFKSRVGVDHWSIPRERAPCAEVAESADLLLIPDLQADACYSQSLLAEQGIRYYCGASLVTREGHGLGSLCVLGTEPRETTPDEIAALKDLAAMVMAQIELQHAFGRVDPLSGLPNRTQFIEDLEDLGRERRGERRLAVLIDLAPPEQLSRGLRVLGPAFMDAMIRQATPLVRAAVTPDKVYHVAATQYAVLVRHGRGGKRVGAKLEERLGRLRDDPNMRALASIAVGVLPLVLGETQPVDVLRTAYGAALDARASRVGFSIHSATSDSAHRRRFRLLADFEAALGSSEQLRLVLQPRIDFETGRCVAVEALLRWCHPDFGEVSPAEFVPLIEHSLLARAMTNWVLDHSLGLLNSLRRSGIELRMSVNISASNLVEEDLAARVQLYLLKHQLRAQDLELEVTESAAIGEHGCGTEQLSALAAAGISIAIGDFGTGYSSLSYLQTLPADTIKLDRSFIAGFEEDDRRVALVRSMIVLFRDLGYRVVAEGVETEAAKDQLRGMGCHEAQGFGFARPMGAEQLRIWIAQNELAIRATRT